MQASKDLSLSASLRSMGGSVQLHTLKASATEWQRFDSFGFLLLHGCVCPPARTQSFCNWLAVSPLAMGGCSSKPETTERGGQFFNNQEPNPLHHGPKATSPTNRLLCTTSQHTLQSLFTQHHRDQENPLDQAQTLQKLPNERKPFHHNNVADAVKAKVFDKSLLQLQEQHRNPVSPFTDLATQEDGDKKALIAQILCLQETSETRSVADFNGGTQASANKCTNDTAISQSIASDKPTDDDASKSVAEYGSLTRPNLDFHPKEEPKMSSLPVLLDSFVLESTAPKVQELVSATVRDAEPETATSESYKHETEGGKVLISGYIKSNSMADGETEWQVTYMDLPMEIPAEAEIREMKQREGTQTTDTQYQGTAAEEPTIKNARDSALESNEAKHPPTEKEDVQQERAHSPHNSFQELEKIERQGSKSKESEKQGVQTKNELKPGMQTSVEEIKQKEWEREEKSCTQAERADILLEEPAFPRRNNSTEKLSVDETVLVKMDDEKATQGSLQSMDGGQNMSENGMPVQNFEHAEEKRCVNNVLPSEKRAFAEAKLERTMITATKPSMFENFEFEGGAADFRRCLEQESCDAVPQQCDLTEVLRIEKDEMLNIKLHNHNSAAQTELESNVSALARRSQISSADGVDSICEASEIVCNAKPMGSTRELENDNHDNSVVSQNKHPKFLNVADDGHTNGNQTSAASIHYNQKGKLDYGNDRTSYTDRKCDQALPTDNVQVSLTT